MRDNSRGELFTWLAFPNTHFGRDYQKENEQHFIRVRIDPSNVWQRFPTGEAGCSQSISTAGYCFSCPRVTKAGKLEPATVRKEAGPGNSLVRHPADSLQIVEARDICRWEFLQLLRGSGQRLGHGWLCVGNRKVLGGVHFHLPTAQARHKSSIRRTLRNYMSSAGSLTSWIARGRRQS